MRRILSFAAAFTAVAAIGVVATPAEAQTGPPQPEVRNEAVTDGGQTAAPGFDEEVEVTNDEVGLIGLQWDGDEAPDFKVTVQNEDGNWEEVEAEIPDGGPDPSTEEAQRVVERRGAEHVTEPIAVEEPSMVRVEVASGAAADVKLVTVTTPSSDDELGTEPDEAGVLPRTVAVVTLLGVAIALVLPSNRRRLSSGALLTVLVVGFASLAVVWAPAAHGQQIPAGPRIFSRADWGANEALRRCGPDYASDVYMGIVHHTVNPNGYSPAETPGIIRGIYAFHTQGNGWCDIGYNFLIDRYGSVYEGRAGGITNPVIGAHAAPFNTGSFGAAIIGDFSFTGPTGASVASLINLFQWKLSVHGVNPYGGVFINGGWYDPIVGHRDVNQTSCPGQGLYGQLGAIRAAIKPGVVYGTPFGNIERASRKGTKVRITGWALDPDTAQPINVHVYVGGPYGIGRGVYFGPANANRPDVGAAFGKGNAHGFNLVQPAFGPLNMVCIYPQGVGPGGQSPLMGCKSFRVDPRGNLEVARRNGNTIRVKGWALDHDTRDPIRIRVFVNGVRLATGRADEARPDVGDAYPGMGDNHGFDLTVQGGGGFLCVKMVNEGMGTSVDFPCRLI